MPASVRFPTAIGECTLSWTDFGLTGFTLPAAPHFPSTSVLSGAAREGSDPSGPAIRSVARERNDPSGVPASSSVAPLARAAIPPAPSSTRAQLASFLPPPASCPAAIAALVARVQRHLAGDLQDFADLTYDWSRVTEFQSRVLRAVLAVKPGRTATYGDLARVLGAKPGTARAIGGAVGANPWPLLIPCHRILGAGGRLTGYSAPGGLTTKAALLALEGAEPLR